MFFSTFQVNRYYHYECNSDSFLHDSFKMYYLLKKKTDEYIYLRDEDNVMHKCKIKKHNIDDNLKYESVKLPNCVNSIYSYCCNNKDELDIYFKSRPKKIKVLIHKKKILFNYHTGKLTPYGAIWLKERKNKK